MLKKVFIMFTVMLVTVQCIYGQLPWRLFHSYDITDTLFSGDTVPSPIIKVYSIAASQINSIGPAHVAYTIPINDSRFSEYIMAALSHARYHQRIQYGTIIHKGDQYEIYRFHPYIFGRFNDSLIDGSLPYDQFLRPYKSNLHSYGIGLNKRDSTIMLDVWISKTGGWIPINWVTGSDSLRPIFDVDTAVFTLTQSEVHLRKIKFDYMVSALITYWDENHRSNFGVTYIDILKDSTNTDIGLRFHAPKRNMSIIP